MTGPLSPRRPGVRAGVFAAVQRGIAVAAATVVGLALGAGTAFAHVSVDPGTVTAGDDAVLTFHVPTESETADTVSVQVKLPVDHPFPEVHPQEVAGWTVKTTTQTLNPPVTEGDVTVTDAVATVTWTAQSGAGIPPEDFAEFAIAVEDVPDVSSLTMPVTQTYSDGSVVDWKDLTPPGGPEPDHPAPVVTVLAAGASGTEASAPPDHRRHRDHRRADRVEHGQCRPSARGDRGGDGRGRTVGGRARVSPAQGHRTPRRRRVIRRVVVVLAVALGALFVGAGVASAHDVLTGSTPANGSTVDAMPSTVTLTFDQPVQNLDPVLLVTGPNGNCLHHRTGDVSGNDISAPVAPGPAGLYRAAYRIISADGHPVTGQITFTLSSAGAGTATGSAPAAGSDSRVPVSNSSGGLGIWIWLGLAIAAVLVVVAVAIALRRPELHPLAAPSAGPERRTMPVTALRRRVPLSFDSTRVAKTITQPAPVGSLPASDARQDPVSARSRRPGQLQGPVEQPFRRFTVPSRRAERAWCGRPRSAHRGPR